MQRFRAEPWTWNKFDRRRLIQAGGTGASAHELWRLTRVQRSSVGPESSSRHLVTQCPCIHVKARVMYQQSLRLLLEGYEQEHKGNVLVRWIVQREASLA